MFSSTFRFGQSENLTKTVKGFTIEKQVDLKKHNNLIKENNLKLRNFQICAVVT